MKEKLKIIELMCEFQHEPIAVDTPNPRLSWKISGNLDDPQSRNIKQSAYQIIVASNKNLLEVDKADLWDSGKVSSHVSCIKYQGKNLASRQCVYWRVQVWDNRDEVSFWSDTSYFVLGLLTSESWDEHSKWIGLWENLKYEEVYPITEELKNVNPMFRKPAREMHPKANGPENDYATGYYARKTFNFPKDASSIKNALLRVVGLGYYETSINGKKVGQRKLDPGVTDYTKRVLYSTYDVSDRVQEQKRLNLEILMAGGWYFPGTPDLFGFDRAQWFAPPKCRAELEIIYEDDSSEFFGTDESWMITDQGPIRFSSVRGGEIYDATRELEMYEEEGIVSEKSEKWKPALAVKPPKGCLCSQQISPIREISTIELSSSEIIDEMKTVFYFPENVAGWVKIDVRGDRGQEITIKLNEKLLESGEVDMDTHSGHTYGKLFQTLKYTCAGKRPSESWEPKFCYQGFRFVQVEGISQDDILSIEAKRIVTDFPRKGMFSCSNALINQIEEASCRTFLNGFHSYPEDCPQREKAGWTEDAALSMQGSIYTFECLRAYEKWVVDLIDAQDSTGQVPVIVPTPGWGRPHEADSNEIGRMADPWWGGAIIYVPWTIYLHYGDERIVEMAYPSMKKYLKFIEEHSDNYIIRWDSLLGDWLEVGSRGTANRTPRELTATQAFYFYAVLMGKMAMILNKPADRDEYETLATQIKIAFNEEFLDRSEGLYAEDSQSAQAISLYVGLVPEDLRDKVLANLVANVKNEHNSHLSTGIVGTYFLYHALAINGHPDLAYDVITAKDFPGFEYMFSFDSPLQAPATTLWEDWGGHSSLCHPVQGCVISFFYEQLAGIRPDEKHPGYDQFVVLPFFAQDLDKVACSLESPRGKIVSNWERTEEGLSWALSIPANSRAKVFIPIEYKSKSTVNGMPLEDLKQANGENLNQEKGKQHFLLLGCGNYSFVLKLS